MKSILILMMSLVFMHSAFAIDEITIVEFQHRANKSKKKYVLLDVRTPYELKDSGKIKGAIIKNAYDPDMKKYVSKLDKKTEYIVYCHSGVRSAKVVKLMEANGIKGINLLGGISEWLKKGLPTEK